MEIKEKKNSYMSFMCGISIAPFNWYRTWIFWAFVQNLIESPAECLDKPQTGALTAVSTLAGKR